LIALVSLAVGTFSAFFEQAHVIDTFCILPMALLKLSLGITALATDQLVKLVNEVFCSKRWLVYIKIAESTLCSNFVTVFCINSSKR
jgi:hypothetical protein